jgi:hypothetical protein
MLGRSDEPSLQHGTASAGIKRDNFDRQMITLNGRLTEYRQTI